MQPIAERELKRKRPDETDQTIIVRMGPAQENEHGEWSSPIEFVIDGQVNKRMAGTGADAFQAITFALAKVPMCLDMHSDKGELSFRGAPGHWFSSITIMKE